METKDAANHAACTAPLPSTKGYAVQRVNSTEVESSVLEDERDILSEQLFLVIYLFR